MSLPFLDELSDADLVGRCRNGSQPAWNALVRRYQRLIYTVPRRAGLSEAQAADVFQTVFSRFFEHLDRIEDGSKVRAWLVTTAKRETLQQLSLARRHTETGSTASAPAGPDDEHETDPLEQIPDPGPLPDELLSALQQQDLLRTALSRLDERSRQLLELLFLQDEPLSYGEISRRLGMPEGSIGPTRARCLERLRTIFHQL